MLGATLVLWSLSASWGAAQQQLVDPDFKARVARPAYPAQGPRVVIDEAHLNFHTAEGQYRPFVDLLRADGYRVDRGTTPFTAQALAGVKVLVIANAGSPRAADTTVPAFTAEEAEVVGAWVRRGGSLLLIADHAPFGLVAEPLARRFGVAMGRGWVFEPAGGGQGITTFLTFSRAQRRLGDHPITRGRNAGERIDVVKTFTGQSILGPRGATPLLILGPDAREAPDRQVLNAAVTAAGGAGAPPVGDRTQGVAFAYGKGRVVVLGEAAMFSAQLIRFRPAIDQPDQLFGLNTPDNDDQQFALNVMHWLSRLLN